MDDVTKGTLIVAGPYFIVCVVPCVKVSIWKMHLKEYMLSQEVERRCLYRTEASREGLKEFIWLANSIATLPPFGPIEGYKWFDQISSQ
jgi:hypothetical protein